MAQARPTPPPISGGPGVEPEPQEPQTPEPAGPEATPPPAPTGTSVRINGREFTVEPELAAALEGREQEFNRKLSDQGREVGDLRAWRRQVEERLQPKPPAQEYDYDTRLFEAPREALTRHKQEIIEEIRQEYMVEQTSRRNWETFYKNNPDLADEDRLVRAMRDELFYQQGWANRRPEEMPAFMDELAKQSRNEILRIARKMREADAPGERLTRGRAPVEGGGGGRRTPEPAEPTGPSTLSDMIRGLQSRHRATVE